VLRISISLAILAEIIIQIGYFFSQSCARKQTWIVVWTQCIWWTRL